MPDPAALTSLLARVEAATGADREIDAAFCKAMSWGWSVSHGEDGWKSIPTAVTASVDATLALIERVLPGWHFTMDTQADLGSASAVCVKMFPPGWPCAKGPDDEGWGPTPALALLAAALRALIAQQESSHG